ncbi:MAG: glycosyl hydrolase, partial [Planctomycetota bacterium]
FSIDQSSWSSTAGGESGHVVARTDDPDVVFGGSYGGFLTMRNHRTGERRNVHAWPDNPMGGGAVDARYRFQWNFPIFTSPHAADVLYVAAQVLFRSTDSGASWERISPDLTRDEESMQQSSGGPLTQDNTSVEYYCTIFAGFESPHEAGVIWCGSDDGLIHLTRDGGANWTNVTPPALPDWSMINCLDADPFEPGGCLVAATRYKLDDFEPYLYRTRDYGATWERIDAGIPRDHFTRALRADPLRPGLLFAGTERGVYASLDGGRSWSSLQLDLPIVPVTDLALKEGDLIAATQGRGYWILDDLSPLRQLDAAAHVGQSVLFVPHPTLRLGMGGGFRRRGPSNAGSNPPAGVVIDYLLGDLEEGTEVRLDILEQDGDLVRSFISEDDESDESGADAVTLGGLPTEPGHNRFVWDLSYPGSKSFPKMILWAGGMNGPRAVPGVYQARLTVGDGSASVSFQLLPDPRSSASVEDLQAQFDLLVEARDVLTEAHTAIVDLRKMRAQLKDLAARLGDGEATQALHASIDEVQEILTSVEETLYQTKNESRQDPLNFPIRLTDKLAGVKGVVGSGDFAPTSQARAVQAELVAAIRAELARLAAVRESALPAINAAALDLAVPAVGDGGRDR